MQEVRKADLLIVVLAVDDRRGHVLLTQHLSEIVADRHTAQGGSTAGRLRHLLQSSISGSSFAEYDLSAQLPPCFFVLNKVDLPRAEWELTVDDLQHCVRKFGVSSVFECSINIAGAVDQLFETAVAAALQHQSNSNAASINTSTGSSSGSLSSAMGSVTSLGSSGTNLLAAASSTARRHAWSAPSHNNSSSTTLSEDGKQSGSRRGNKPLKGSTVPTPTTTTTAAPTPVPTTTTPTPPNPLRTVSPPPTQSNTESASSTRSPSPPRSVSPPLSPTHNNSGSSSPTTVGTASSTPPGSPGTSPALSAPQRY